MTKSKKIFLFSGLCNLWFFGGFFSDGNHIQLYIQRDHYSLQSSDWLWVLWECGTVNTQKHSHKEWWQNNLPIREVKNIIEVAILHYRTHQYTHTCMQAVHYRNRMILFIDDLVHNSIHIGLKTGIFITQIVQGWHHLQND